MKQILKKIKNINAKAKSELAYIHFNDCTTEAHERVVLAYNFSSEIDDLINEILEANNAKE